MRISDWSSDVCSSDLRLPLRTVRPEPRFIALLFHECLWRLRGTQLRRMQMHGRVREIGERAGMIEVQMREHDVVNVAGGKTERLDLRERRLCEIGRASCRERVGQYV